MKELDEIMPLIDKYTSCEGKLAIHHKLNGGHEDEWTSNHRISKMTPVVWLGADTIPHDMHEYLTILGVTPKKAMDMVYSVYDEAKGKASSYGISAPKLNANEWDCYWCISMMMADYWLTHKGDLEIAAELAYQYLSDPDR